MPEMRDPREITVAGEARSTRPVKPARRPAALPAADGSEWRAMLGAVAGGTFRMCRRNPGALLGSVVALAAVAAVSMNALGYQTGRHPAPILPKIAIRQDAVKRDPVQKDAAQKALPDKVAEAARPPEPARAPARTVEASKSVGDVVKSVGDVAKSAGDGVKPSGRDAIADLIRSGETTASVTPKSQVAAQKPQASVMQAQKALAKLGYGPLKADGMMGAGTRAAIEKFERDRKLPVKGEAAGRTLRELAARAALPPA